MATTAVTIEEYLSTSYRPGCDYMEGDVQEGNLGRIDPSRLQYAGGLPEETGEECRRSKSRLR